MPNINLVVVMGGCSDWSPIISCWQLHYDVLGCSPRNQLVLDRPFTQGD